MTERNISIRKKLLSIVLFPIILLSSLITIIGMSLFYGFYTQSIRNELVSTTDTMLDCLDLALQGDYEYRDGMLLKGDLNISNSKMLLHIKEKSQIDTTLFWWDTRILTTIEDADGNLAVGTFADSMVIDVVLLQGESFFPDKLEINGIGYIGYYVPLENSDGKIVGMIFAGKQRKLVYEKIIEIILWYVVFSVLTVIVSVFITRKFSSQMISDISLINQFLKTISEGNLRAELDEKIMERGDELASIGQYAYKMRGNLQMLIERDSLTELYNRRSCLGLIDAIIHNKETYCVIMCDIDLFKKINDSYGHDAGDYVLKEISGLLKSSVKDSGFASRWGGEEFLLVYKMGFEKTKEKAKQLQQSIWDHGFIYQGTALHVTMTFGVAEGMQGISYEQVIKEADEKLYVGKNSGRDKIVF